MPPDCGAYLAGSAEAKRSVAPSNVAVNSALPGVGLPSPKFATTSCPPASDFSAFALAALLEASSSEIAAVRSRKLE